jgi:MYXO-CTERM domain-containing protein
MQGEAAELTPRAPLEPHTRYVIRAKSPHVEPAPDERLEFTTGAEATKPRRLSAPSLEATVLTKAANGCAPGSFLSCISTGMAMSLIEVRGTDGTLLIRDVIAGDHGVWPIERPGCVRAFTRDAAGRLSEASELCEPELASRPARQGERGGLTLRCEQGQFRPAPEELSDAGVTDASTAHARVIDSGSCSTSGPGSAAGSLTWLAGLGLVLAARWRHRS